MNFQIPTPIDCLKGMRGQALRLGPHVLTIKGTKLLKNPAISKTISVIILAIFFITLEYLFKLSDNQIFQRILKEEKFIVDFFLNSSNAKNI